MKKTSKNTYTNTPSKKREMLRWNTFSHDYSTNKRLRVGEKKNEIRENVNLTTKNSWWLTCLFAKERIRPRCFLFFPCSSFHIHIHKLNRKTICFIICSCLPSSFPLLFSFFTYIYNVDTSFFYKCEMFVRVVLSVFLSLPHQ